MPPGHWQHYGIQLAAPAEHYAATVIAAGLDRAQQDKHLYRWWYLRKPPGWRVRCELADLGATAVETRLAQWTRQGVVIDWTRGIYEPERAAFGGRAGMDIAHTLFHHDSQHCLAHSTDTHPRIGQRETSVLLFSAMLRGAGLDWFEQGAVWDQIATLRPPSPTYQPQHHATPTTHTPKPEVQTPQASRSASTGAAPTDAAARAARWSQAMHRLMTIDPSAQPELVPPAWLAAFATTGEHLAELARTGRLDRGLRAVLAHHFIFHANRAGISGVDQATLAALATETVFHTTPCATRTAPATTGPPANAATVTTTTTTKAATMTNNPTPDNPTYSNADPTHHAGAGERPVAGDPAGEPAEEVRRRLVDQLLADEAIRTAPVEMAMRGVPRHLFLPGVPLAEAYADEPVYIRRADDGTRTSAASQPAVVAAMLEQLDVHAGDNILEIGAATGYNAGLLAALSGPAGRVTTIDIDDDLVAEARDHLHAAGIDHVTVLAADGARGHATAAPYDRIIATTGAHAIPGAWLEQLAPTGRLVVPVRLAGAASRSIAFEREPCPDENATAPHAPVPGQSPRTSADPIGDQDQREGQGQGVGGGGWRSVDSQMSVFMPLRGANADPRRMLDLTGTGDAVLQTHADNAHATDPDTLTGVLNTPAHEVWTEVWFGPGESFEWLDLWLCCHLPNPLMRMEVAREAKNSGLVRPLFPAVTMATTTAAGALAYLTMRPSRSGRHRYQVGVIGHGDRGEHLTDQVAHEITTWGQDFRTRRVSFAIPNNTDDTGNSGSSSARVTGSAAYVVALERLGRPMTVTWH